MRCFGVFPAKRLKMLFPFIPLQPDEISFEEGDILYIIDRVNLKFIMQLI